MTEKKPEPEVDMHVKVPTSLRDKVYGYLDTEGGYLKPFIRGLIEEFFENEDWLNLHIGRNKRKKKYWNKRV